MTLDKRHRELIDEGDELFSERRGLDSLYQEIAENFYPERADFTTERATGENFAEGLDTSFPILARRELGDAIGATMRPSNVQWFDITTKRPERLDDNARRWLAMATRTQWRALYDRNSQFVRATKEGDHDFAAFGMNVISSEVKVDDYSGPMLLHRCWHIRDTVWKDDHTGKICPVHRNWKVSARELIDLFPKTVSPKVRKIAEKDPFHEVNCRHVIVRSAHYDSKIKKPPYVSVYLDLDHQTLLEERGSVTAHYIIPRWKTVPGSQYGFSPASIAGLPDARLLQAMSYTVTAAGEFAVNPALVGVEEAIKGAVEAFPGGFTAVDAQYDERLGEVLRPLNKGGDRALPITLDMLKDVRQQLGEAFYLSKFSMPPAGEGGMSPFEVQQRVAEFVRKALPLFEPMESEYNAALMDQDFTLLLKFGAFGPPDQIPESLAGQETDFTFQSPLRQSIERMKGQQFVQALQIVSQGAQLDPANVHMLDAQRAQKDALDGSGIPAEWIRSPEEIQERAQAQQQAQSAAAMMQAAGPVVEAVAKAAPKEAPKEEVAYDNAGRRAA